MHRRPRLTMWGVIFFLLKPIDTWNFLPKLRFFYILVVLRLDLSQISFSLVENTFTTRQLAVLTTRIAFKTFWPRHAQKSKFWDGFWTRKWPTALHVGFSTFEMFSLFFPFGFLFAAVIGLLPGLLGVKKCIRKSHRGGQFLPWSS